MKLRREVQIALAATVFTCISAPILLYSVTPPQTEIDPRISELVVPEFLPTTIDIQVSAPMHSDLHEAVQTTLDREFDFAKIKFSVSDKCTNKSEICINGKPGKTDSLILSPKSKMPEFSFSQESLTEGRVPQLVSMVVHKYLDPLIFEVPAHEEVTLGYSPSYHITFSLLSEGGHPLKWELGQAVEKYMDTLLGFLNANVADLTIDSQLGHFAKLGCERKPVLEKSELSTFVNSAEWSLASTSSYPTINFVLYVPESPLEINNSASNSFILPQWGGVKIADVNHFEFTLEDLEPVMEVFKSQLVVLLGMRESEMPNLNDRPSVELGLRTLARRRIALGLRSAVDSLHSLQRLVSNVKNFPVPVDVQLHSNKALHGVMNAEVALALGDLEAAKRETAIGFKNAEQAFFNKHMIEQAYFPNEHKLAVYIPLIGPFCLVVFGSWLRLRRQSKALESIEKKKNTKDTNDSTE